MSPTDVETRVTALRAWCGERIQQCRRDELKFSSHSDAFYAAATERVVLMQVLNKLGFPVPPHNEEDLRYRGTTDGCLPKGKS